MLAVRTGPSQQIVSLLRSRGLRAIYRNSFNGERDNEAYIIDDTLTQTCRS